jgi:5-oxopent-3-ene-1,2,5-tricarboxylate decarboxylase / 2-hydroxyhepta-2,4-diene-1,7-dioate isomerase
MGKAIVKLQGNQQAEEIEVNPTTCTVKRDGKENHIENLSLDAPVSGTIYGTLLNYKGSLAALGAEVNEAPYKEPPKAPILYIKPVNTIIGYGMSIPLPIGVPELEVGAALGVVIGRNASRVKEDEAMEYVAGYTVVNDISVPHKSVYRPAISQKSRDGFCPVGPWVIERDAVANPDALGIRVFVNGELRQENTTENLIRSVSHLIADISDFMTLSVGDMLLVGVPENAPIVQVGDRIRIEIDEVGILENTVLHEDVLITGGEER